MRGSHRLIPAGIDTAAARTCENKYMCTACRPETACNSLASPSASVGEGSKLALELLHIEEESLEVEGGDGRGANSVERRLTMAIAPDWWEA